MSHPFLAAGSGLVTASGCVWYVPALVELRAGADRPVSRRMAAAACVSGWTAAAVATVLLLVAEAWWLPCAAVGAGTVATAVLRTGAAVRRRREEQEAAHHWAQLGALPHPLGAGDSRHVVAVLIGCGLVTAVTVATIKVAAGPEGTSEWLAAAVTPAAVLGLFLAVAFAHGRTVHRRDRNGRAR
ncbi:hypothetical protein [Streptomyces spectabilis]|uniref:Uncharacterized protein n=1 Tax=Streptomyces spectabilis TaxID=68270 RepID=A0A516RJN1_STRST|nr:hypothetical protein [Streptomyces spectabilis]QDQ15870.1 hypothetical protein FH965_39355 [Streptomyces spectabilis]